ncbi:hypothetical protein KIPB_000922 [Kipferlia bialata]|uniref:EGF-like domain-containing protein n=1 Tax=Kipferlia bialata TaxID=797122 RepID=A0A9K3CQ05_9EUKA|nr:hypothetical protein KIPB_000922 [Kipferlia bialata]|eukprot:g922.t1
MARQCVLLRLSVLLLLLSTCLCLECVAEHTESETDDECVCYDGYTGDLCEENAVFSYLVIYTLTRWWIWVLAVFVVGVGLIVYWAARDEGDILRLQMHVWCHLLVAAWFLVTGTVMAPIYRGPHWLASGIYCCVEWAVLFLPIMLTPMMMTSWTMGQPRYPSKPYLLLSELIMASCYALNFFIGVWLCRESAAEIDDMMTNTGTRGFWACELACSVACFVLGTIVTLANCFFIVFGDPLDDETTAIEEWGRVRAKRALERETARREARHQRLITSRCGRGGDNTTMFEAE